MSSPFGNCPYCGWPLPQTTAAGHICPPGAFNVTAGGSASGGIDWQDRAERAEEALRQARLNQSARIEQERREAESLLALHERFFAAYRRYCKDGASGCDEINAAERAVEDAKKEKHGPQE